MRSTGLIDPQPEPAIAFLTRAITFCYGALFGGTLGLAVGGVIGWLVWGMK